MNLNEGGRSSSPKKFPKLESIAADAFYRMPRTSVRQGQLGSLKRHSGNSVVSLYS